VNLDYFLNLDLSMNNENDINSFIDFVGKLHLFRQDLYMGRIREFIMF